ncbi:OmpA/MotB domain protein [Kribbella flavida DSM 17836]|uniref:OmpA/MotB domain protein n=1 Tax=Kribbella flavida (strain DSM 17836 / JCM 10339 / NBRC 14399) TaxID=479435 RepID=D2Q218_KRIFD|nr:OmpA family protein [Kribbella flavida]ADB33964.1 OmpA/MotB domain protein [Kribbella flavida DSM 17836]
MPGSARRPGRLWLLALVVVPLVLAALLVAVKGEGLRSATADDGGAETAQPSPSATASSRSTAAPTPTGLPSTPPASEPAVAPFAVVRTDGGLSVTAVVQSQAARDTITSEAQALLEAGETFADHLSVDPSVGPLNPAALVGVLRTVATATTGTTVSFDGTSVTLTGAVADQATKATAARAAAKAAPGAVVANQLRVPSAEKPPLSEACQTFESRLAQLTSQHKIIFLSGTAIVNEKSRGSVVRVAALLRTCGTARVELAGHTDNLGDPSTSLPLSQRRADAVKATLVRLGVPAGRIISRGYGEFEPVASNRTSAGRIANRRVEIRVP